MSGCPSPEILEAFLEEQVSDTDRDSLSRHIDRCDDCQARLEASAGEAPLSQTFSAVVPGGQADFLTRLKKSPPAGNSLSGTGRAKTATPGKRDSGGFAKLPEVAGYEILGELGRGGMGVVYKARQVGLDRLVALKMILSGRHAGPKDLARFRQEAEAVARLRHPNLIQIHEIGESEGRPYLALEFVEGTSLAQLLRGTPQPLAPAARLVETLAAAIHYAHQRNIVHRDLKPANILLEGRGARDEGRGEESDPFSLAPHPSTLAPVPKITDFGLAKRLDGHQHGTQTGDVVGTPSYMAPEQAASNGGGVGPAADVYALGAILYELLTGRPPFRGPTALDTVLQVLHEEPVRPSYLRRDLPRDLETICLKCLAKEPGKRYASAEGLADDLRRYRKGQPIKARAVGVAERAWKWARHRPLSATLLAGLLLVALLAYGGITWQWQEARIARDNMEDQREQAVEARRKETAQRKQAGVSLYFSRIAQSQLQWRVNDFTSAKQSLTNCLPLPGQEDHRGWEWRYLQGLYHNDLFTLPHGHGGLGGGVAYDPKGGRIASVVSGPPDGETPLPGEVLLWDARTGEQLKALAGPDTTHRLAFAPDGRRLALATTDGVVMIWDAQTGKELLRRPMHQGAVWALAFSPDGRTVASAGSDRVVRVWDSGTGKVRHEFRGHDKQIQSVAFHPHKPLLASGSWDATVKLWDTDTGKEAQTLRGHKLAVYCVAFSPDGQSLVSSSSNGNLKLWELATGRIVQSLTGDTGAVLSIAFSPDGRYLAKGGKDGTVRVWHLATGVERKSFRGHSTPVESVSFSPDGRRVVSLSPGEGVAKVWDLTRHPEYATFARTEADVEAIAFSERGERLVSATLGGKLQTWDAATGLLLGERLVPLAKDILSPAIPVSFSPGGKFLAGRTEEDARAVKVWDAATGAETASCKGHTLPVYCVRFSRDGRRLATCACATQHADPTHELKVWDAATGEPLFSRTGKGRVFNVALSPDGRLLAWGGQGGLVALADWKSPHTVASVTGHQGDVSGLAFSPDGDLLASAGMEDRAVNLWRVQQFRAGSATPRHRLAAPSLICDLAFSPDGRRLAAISRDMVKLWEVENGHEALTLRGGPQRFWDPSFNPRLAFSPDGTQLAGTNWDESISTWEAPPLDTEEQFARLQEKRRLFAEQRGNSWHLHEAELCLGQKNLAAVRFHLKHVQVEALSGPLQARRARLEAALEMVAPTPTP